MVMMGVVSIDRIVVRHASELLPMSQHGQSSGGSKDYLCVIEVRGHFVECFMS